MHGVPISSFDVLAAYRRVLASLGRSYGEGLFFQEALRAAQDDAALQVVKGKVKALVTRFPLYRSRLA